MKSKNCSVESCTRLAFARGFCLKHYKRMRRLGGTKLPEIIIDKSLWTDVNIAWVAGIIEGEGNFNLRKDSKSARIRVRMTDKDVLDKLLQITKIGKINGPYKRNNPKWKDSWDWTVGIKKEFIELSYAILPWLLSRRKSVCLYILSIVENKNALKKM